MYIYICMICDDTKRKEELCKSCSFLASTWGNTCRPMLVSMKGPHRVYLTECIDHMISESQFPHIIVDLFLTFAH